MVGDDAFEERGEGFQALAVARKALLAFQVRLPETAGLHAGAACAQPVAGGQRLHIAIERRACVAAKAREPAEQPGVVEHAGQVRQCVQAARRRGKGKAAGTRRVIERGCDDRRACRKEALCPHVPNGEGIDAREMGHARRPPLLIGVQDQRAVGESRDWRLEIGDWVSGQQISNLQSPISQQLRTIVEPRVRYQHQGAVVAASQRLTLEGILRREAHEPLSQAGAARQPEAAAIWAMRGERGLHGF